jgi:hypothetical protein
MADIYVNFFMAWKEAVFSWRMGPILLRRVDVVGLPLFLRSIKAITPSFGRFSADLVLACFIIGVNSSFCVSSYGPAGGETTAYGSSFT